MKRMVMVAAATAAAIAAGAVWGQETTGWSLGGSVASQPSVSYFDTGSLDAADFSYGSATTLGLDLRARGERARAEGSAEAAVLTGASAQAAWSASAEGLARPDELLVPSYASGSAAPETLIALRLRALYLKLDFDWASLTAGRQVVNYGRGVLWSPTDLFTELDLSGISPVRLGTDALRLAMPLSATGGFDIVAAPASAPVDGRYAARLSGLVAGIDGAVMGAWDGRRNGWTFGADFKADIEVSIEGEVVYDLPGSGRTGTMRAAGGADWSFGDFVVAAEYYYNGSGAAADPLFPGVHNLYGSLTWQATELFTLAGTVIWDIGETSGSATLLASLSAAQNAVLQGYLKAAYDRPQATRWSAQAGLNLEVKF